MEVPDYKECGFAVRQAGLHVNVESPKLAGIVKLSSESRAFGEDSDAPLAQMSLSMGEKVRKRRQSPS